MNFFGKSSAAGTAEKPKRESKDPLEQAKEWKKSLRRVRTLAHLLASVVLF